MSWSRFAAITQCISICTRNRILHTSTFISRCYVQQSKPSRICIESTLSNGNHLCPGCGSAFHFDRNADASISGGFIDWSLLKHRIKWNADAVEGEPFFTVLDGKQQSGDSVFDKQERWFQREYTNIERDRISKRASIESGTVNQRLQELYQQDGLLRTLDSSSDPPSFVDDDNLKSQGDARDSAASNVFGVYRPLICQRCHDLSRNHNFSTSSKRRNRGELASNSMTAHTLDNLPEKSIQLLRRSLKSQCIVVALVDLTNIPHSIPLEQLDHLLKSSDSVPRILVVGTKMDLLPKYMQNRGLLSEYLMDICKLHCPKMYLRFMERVEIVSTQFNVGVDDLRQTMLRWAKSDDANVFLLGHANAGKSMLLNILMGRNQFYPVTVNGKFGTTAGVVQKRLHLIRNCTSQPVVDGNLRLIDLPGVINFENSLLINSKAALFDHEIKRIVIDRETRAMRYKLMVGESGFFSGMIRIDCVSMSNRSNAIMLKIYGKSKLPYFRRPTAEADEFYFQRLGKANTSHELAPPVFYENTDCVERRIEQFSLMKIACELHVKGTDPVEIGFADGVGWMTINLLDPSDEAHVCILTPHGAGIAERKVALCSRFPRQ